MTESEKPEQPSVSLKNPFSLFSRQNLKVGWALLWRAMLPYGLFLFIAQNIQNLQAAIGQDIFSFSAFCLLISSLVFFAKRVASKEYATTLTGILWPLLWRTLIALFSIVMIAVFEMAGMEQFGNLAGVVLTAIVSGLMLVALFGWALHRQLEIAAGNRNRL